MALLMCFRSFGGALAHGARATRGKIKNMIRGLGRN
jgi:hypothetical protein